MNTQHASGKVAVVTSADSKTNEAKNLVRSTAATDPGHRTVRVISAWVQAPRYWRADTKRFANNYRNGKRPDLIGGEAARIRTAAATATLLDVPVGIITGVREEAL